MKRELIYNEKKVSHMTLGELRNQLQVNHKRSVIRAVFLLIVAVAAIVIYPIAVIAPVACFAVTQYWMTQNNKEIIKEIESRNR